MDPLTKTLIPGRAGSYTLAASYILAQAIRRLEREEPVTLVLCGKQAIDGVFLLRPSVLLAAPASQGRKPFALASVPMVI